MTTKKRDLKGGLLSSLTEEEKKVEDKFKRAELHFEEEEKIAPKAIQGKVNLEPKTIPQKERLVRDAFTFPPADHVLFESIQKKAMQAGVMVNKSEIVRAGLHLLNGLSKTDLGNALGIVEKLKVGRKS